MTRSAPGLNLKLAIKELRHIQTIVERAGLPNAAAVMADCITIIDRNRKSFITEKKTHARV